MGKQSKQPSSAPPVVPPPPAAQSQQNVPLATVTPIAPAIPPSKATKVSKKMELYGPHAAQANEAPGVHHPTSKIFLRLLLMKKDSDESDNDDTEDPTTKEDREQADIMERLLMIIILGSSYGANEIFQPDKTMGIPSKKLIHAQSSKQRNYLT